MINTHWKIKMGGVWDEKMCSSVLLKTSYTLTQSYIKEYSFALIILSVYQQSDFFQIKYIFIVGCPKNYKTAIKVWIVENALFFLLSCIIWHRFVLACIYFHPTLGLIFQHLSRLHPTAPKNTKILCVQLCKTEKATKERWKMRYCRKWDISHGPFIS